MSADAIIRERGYTGYDGPRAPERIWRVLAEHTARALGARRGVRRAIVLAFVPALIAGVVMYVERHLVKGAGGAHRPLLLLTHAYGVLAPALFIALAAAGGTLAEDRRAGALPFYFARPLSPRDYLHGRLLGTGIVVSLAIVAPTTALALYDALLAGDGSQLLHALGGAAVILMLGLAETVLVSIYALLGGAVASARGGAQSFVGLVFVLPWIVGGIGKHVVDGPWASLLSVPSLVEAIGDAAKRALGDDGPGMIDVLARAVSTPDAGSGLPAWLALVALVALGACGYLVLRARVERLGEAGGDAGAGA